MLLQLSTTYAKPVQIDDNAHQAEVRSARSSCDGDQGRAARLSRRARDDHARVQASRDSFRNRQTKLENLSGQV